MVSKVKVIDIETSNLWTTEQVLSRAWERVDQTWWAGGITAYTIEDGTMDGTTPVVISHPQIELDTPFNIYYESEPVGNITRTLGAGTITIVSDDPADAMNFRLVIFWFGNKTTYIQSEVITLDGAWPRVISDSRILADTPVNLFPLQEPTGYLTIVAGAWEVTITSSASETNLEVRYIGFTELSVWSILNDAYGVARATDETNGASRKALYDKIESMEWDILNSTWIPTVWTTYTVWSATWNSTSWAIDNVFTFNKAGNYTISLSYSHNWTGQAVTWFVTKNWIDLVQFPESIRDFWRTWNVNITWIVEGDIIWIRTEDYWLICWGNIEVKFEYTPITTWRLTNI